MLYRALLRPALFALDPEKAHELALTSMALLARSPLLCIPPLPARYAGYPQSGWRVGREV